MASHSIARTRAAAIAACAIALTVAFGTGAFAAGKITSADIKNGAVTTKKIANGAVTTKKIANKAVTSGKLNTGSVQSGAIKDGTITAKDLNSALNAVLPTKVTNLNGSFVNGDTTVKMTPDGVTFGPYANGGTNGASLIYNGLNGKQLKSVKNLVYYARYMSTTDTGGVGVPYLRIFLSGNHDAIFSPNTQTPNPDTAQGPFHEWVATSGSWRYDDDAGNNPDESYASLLAAHGTETITSIRVTVGNSAGTQLQSLMRWMQINGKTYNFGS